MMKIQSDPQNPGSGLLGGTTRPATLGARPGVFGDAANVTD
jgi:hypothetical protein